MRKIRDAYWRSHCKRIAEEFDIGYYRFVHGSPQQHSYAQALKAQARIDRRREDRQEVQDLD